MEKDNILYLKNLAKRTNYYGSVKKRALRYIHKNKISEKAISVNILLISALWAAQQLDHEIREDDLLIFFDLQQDNTDDIVSSPMRLSPDHTQLTLEELFDITVESFKH
jgi:hypothetical protein